MWPYKAPEKNQPLDVAGFGCVVFVLWLVLWFGSTMCECTFR